MTMPLSSSSSSSPSSSAALPPPCPPQNIAAGCQRPTLENIHIRSVEDAKKLFYAVQLGLLPKIERRLDAQERRMLRPGNVYVWEEKGPSTDSYQVSIERWTEGLSWSASRIRDDFLMYYENVKKKSTDSKDADGGGNGGNSQRARSLENEVLRDGERDLYVKQTYSVHRNDVPPDEIPANGSAEGAPGKKDVLKRKPRKWHLNAYFTKSTEGNLKTIDSIPFLRDLAVPDGIFSSARQSKKGANGNNKAEKTAAAEDSMADNHAGPSSNAGSTATPGKRGRGREGSTVQRTYAPFPVGDRSLRPAPPPPPPAPAKSVRLPPPPQPHSPPPSHAPQQAHWHQESLYGDQQQQQAENWLQSPYSQHSQAQSFHQYPVSSPVSPYASPPTPVNVPRTTSFDSAGAGYGHGHGAFDYPQSAGYGFGGTSSNYNQPFSPHSAPAQHSGFSAGLHTTLHSPHPLPHQHASFVTPHSPHPFASPSPHPIHSSNSFTQGRNTSPLSDSPALSDFHESISGGSSGSAGRGRGAGVHNGDWHTPSPRQYVHGLGGYGGVDVASEEDLSGYMPMPTLRTDVGMAMGEMDGMGMMSIDDQPVHLGNNDLTFVATVVNPDFPVTTHAGSPTSSAGSGRGRSRSTSSNSPFRRRPIQLPQLNVPATVDLSTGGAYEYVEETPGSGSGSAYGWENPEYAGGEGDGVGGSSGGAHRVALAPLHSLQRNHPYKRFPVDDRQLARLLGPGAR